MRIVADTSRIVAALIKDSTTRRILFDKSFEFVTPDYTITEIQEHRDRLMYETSLNDEGFEILLALLFGYIKIIPKQDYKNFEETCKNDISDPDDIPILATAIVTEADGIWTHDPHFNE